MCGISVKILVRESVYEVCNRKSPIGELVSNMAVVPVGILSRGSWVVEKKEVIPSDMIDSAKVEGSETGLGSTNDNVVSFVGMRGEAPISVLFTLMLLASIDSSREVRVKGVVSSGGICSSDVDEADWKVVNGFIAGDLLA